MALIKKRKLADDVIEEIKRMIQSGKLKEGDKLPNQNEFASQLGISRTSLREALTTLVFLGALEQRQGYGTVVKSKFPALYIDQLSLPIIANGAATNELIEARSIIEISAVSLASQKATKEQIEDMGVLIEEMSKAFKERKTSDYIEKDIAFHFLIAKATQNRIIVNILMTIRGLMEQFMHEVSMVLPEIWRRTLKSHRSIYNAVKNKNRRNAIAEMKRHMQDLQKNIEKYYKIAGKKL